MLVEMNKDRNVLIKRILEVFYHHPNGFVSTMLVGNNVVLVMYGIFFADLFDTTIFSSLDAGWRVTADTLLSTMVILFTGEFIPKTLFKSMPNTFMKVFAIPALIFYIVLWPVSKFTTLLSRGILYLFGIKMDTQEEDDSFTKVDLGYLVKSTMDTDNGKGVDDEVKIFQNALEFPDIKVRDCMIPRTEIDAVNINGCTLAQLMDKFIESGHSKIIVYNEDIDHIIGYIHSSEMFRHSDTWQQCIRKMPFVPETMTAEKLMRTFLQEKKSLGVVVDEFGGTSGVVALEDIVEEIFGDIEDEHDTDRYIAHRSDDGTYILSARLEISKVNEMFNLDLPDDDDYVTIAGLILNKLESFPKLNEVVRIGKFEFKILKTTATKIGLVSLKVKPQSSN